MNVFVCYDVSAKHDEVKRQMRSKNYLDAWASSKDTTTRYYLPDSSLWKPNTELSIVKNDLLQITKELGVTLLRCIVLSASPWDGISGVKSST